MTPLHSLLLLMAAASTHPVRASRDIYDDEPDSPRDLPSVPAPPRRLTKAERKEAARHIRAGDKAARQRHPEVEAVRCPICGSKVGKDCRGTGYHPDRVRAAEAQRSKT